MKLFALIATAILLLLPIQARAGGVGFSEITVTNGAEKPLVVGVWYPSNAPPGPRSRASLGELLSLSLIHI